MALKVKPKYLTIDCCTRINDVDVPVWPTVEEIEGISGTLGIGVYAFPRSAAKLGRDVVTTHNLSAGDLVIKHKGKFYYSIGLPTNSDELLYYLASHVEEMWEIKDTKKPPTKIDGSIFEPNSTVAHLDNWLWVTDYSIHIDHGVKFAEAHNVSRFTTLFRLPDYRDQTPKGAVRFAADLNGEEAPTEDAIIAVRKGSFFVSNGWDPVAQEVLNNEQLQQIISHVDALRIHNPEPPEGEEVWKLLVPDIDVDELSDTHGVVVPDMLDRVLRNSSRAVADTWRAIDKSDLDDFSVRALTLACSSELLKELMRLAEGLDGHGGRTKVVKFLEDIMEQALPEENEVGDDEEEEDD